MTFMGGRSPEEEHSLLRSQNYTEIDPAPKQPASRWNLKSVVAIVLIALAAVAGIVGCVGVLVGMRTVIVDSEPVSSLSPPLSESQPVSLVARERLAFEVHNSYGVSKYGKEHPFIGSRYIAEPHRISTFSATGPIAKQAHAVIWQISGSSSSLGEFKGLNAEVVFTEIGPHAVSVVALDSNGEVIDSIHSEVYTVYG